MVLKIVLNDEIHTVSEPLRGVAGQTENQINRGFYSLFLERFDTFDKSFQIRRPVHGIKGSGVGALQSDFKLAESGSGILAGYIVRDRLCPEFADNGQFF